MEKNNYLFSELKRARRTKISETLHTRFMTMIIPSIREDKKESFIFFLSLRFASFAFAAILLIGSAVAVAARESKPGELLYPVKSFIERVAPKPIKPFMQKPIGPTETPTQIPTPHEVEKEDHLENEKSSPASPSGKLPPDGEIDRKSVNELEPIEKVLSDTIEENNNGNKNEEHENRGKKKDNEGDKKEEIAPTPKTNPSHILPLPVSIDIPPVQIHL